jgi:carboxylesterase type B
MTETDAEQGGRPDPKYSGLPNLPSHGAELNYMWGGVRGGGFKTERARSLSGHFQRFWTNFAKFGTPDPTGKEWPRFTADRPVVMNMQQPPVLSTDFVDRHNCAFLRKNSLVRY